MANPREKPRRVLVVEDDPDFGPMLQRSLSALPADVELVECGEETAASIGKNRYDLVVIDIWLPRTHSALLEKRRFEREFDELTEELIRSDNDEQRKSELREKMELKTSQAREKLERLGGVKILDDLPNGDHVAAILFLTAMGNSEIRTEAETAARRIGCQWVYLVKPQSPEAILAHAKGLLPQD